MPILAISFDIILEALSRAIRQEKAISTQIRKAQRPIKINTRGNMPRHIFIKLMKFKHKQQALKTAREKQQITYRGSS